MLYWKKELEMLLRLFKSFGMEEVKTVVDAYPCDGDMKKNKEYPLSTGQRYTNQWKNWTELWLGLVQIPVAPDESNGGEIFWMCASSNIAVYATEITKLEVNGKLVTLQPGSSQLFSENENFIVKYDINQSSMNSPHFTVFHYYLVMDVDVAYYTTTNALLNAEIKNIQSHCIFFEDALVK